MKSYLSLIPISAKVHKRQNRMTILCILSAVFMVTAVFSMADMGIRMERARLVRKHGDITALSGSTMAQTLYLIAAVLFVMILLAGVLMIASSINSNVAQRTKFFGMMRCIGMSRQQIIRFVRLEALNWCKDSIPFGILLGTVVTWILCAALKYIVGGEFAIIPMWQISPIGIISGVVMGIVTVLIAASAPARRAAKVSPVAAVSGNVENKNNGMQAARTMFGRIEVSLGIHHAVASGKNFLLMTGSFAFSIILFLSFTVLIQFIGYIMPQSSAASDINIFCEEEGKLVDRSLADEISAMNGVKQVFGRSSSFDITAKVKGQNTLIDVISYEDYDLSCLKKDRMLKYGSEISKVYGDSRYVLAVYDEKNALKIGDSINIGDEEYHIAGLLKYNPFREDGSADGKITLITSNDTYKRLTGIRDYALLMIQLKSSATDADVTAIQNVVDEKYQFVDQRDQRTTSTYIAFKLFVYGFLIIITMVTVLNIMNSISMSVSARMKQYGAMRAVGMDERQMTSMIAFETFTYSITGCIVGLIGGLLFSKLLFTKLITAHFSYASFHIPIVPVLVVLLIVLVTSCIAIYAPAKRIHKMEVTEVINEL